MQIPLYDPSAFVPKGIIINGLMTPQAIIAEWQKSPNSAYHQLVILADSIALHGQINPIKSERRSVRLRPIKNNLPGVEYLIVTGERRWWAHVLLWTQGRSINEGAHNAPLASSRHPADQIKISHVAKGVSIRAHQLIENVVREDINAVEKAVGMWSLRYELSGKNYSSILPTSAEEKYLVDWKEVEKSLGVSNRYRQYVISVLKLTPDALRLVQEHRLSESTIRPVTQKLHKHPDLQMQALRQLVTWQKSEEHHSLVKEVKQLVNDLVAEIPPVGQTPRPSLLPLELPKNRRAKANKAPEAPEAPVSKASVPAPVPAPAPAPVTAPAPVPTPTPVTAPLGVGEQKPLIATPKTLRNRPASTDSRVACVAHHDLSSAITHLTEALDQINTNDPLQVQRLTDNLDSLMTLQRKIDQLLRANAVD